MTWEVVVVFTQGHCVVLDCETEVAAREMAVDIGASGFFDPDRRYIVPVSQIGAVYFREKKAP